MADDLKLIIQELFDINAIRFGEFKLKSGILSPIYFNLRVIIGYPNLLRRISELLYNAAKSAGAEFNLTCGVPYTALPLATCMSLDHDIPMVIRRREAKDYGTRQMIEGVYQDHDVCLVVEDVVTSGGSVLETAQELNRVNLICKDAVVLLDRGQGGKERLKEHGINLHSILEMHRVLDVLLELGKIDKVMFDRVHQFLSENQFQPKGEEKKEVLQKKNLEYKDRIAFTKNTVAKCILEVMERKQTNLCFSVDVTSSAEVLRLADLIGPHVCIVKTHVDIVTDFSEEFVASLTALAKKHDFVIFEDRKFADIGSTVRNQYSQGLYKIKDWAQLTNAHGVPGDGVVKGLREASGGCERACLLIAQMSSSGALTNQGYSQSIVAMAKENDDFVIGFISTTAVCDDPKYLHMTPGVNLSVSGDSLGQQYLTPDEVVGKRNCDIIIVGRGIFQSSDPVASAIKYKEAGFKAYLTRVKGV